MIILAINPGSTSTKVAVFENSTAVFKDTIEHEHRELSQFASIQDQLGFRMDTVLSCLDKHRVDIRTIEVFVGRGGGLLPTEGGIYRIDSLLVQHAAKGMMGSHPAQLASQICWSFSEQFHKHAYIVNPPDTDEFIPQARVCGVKGMYRQSHVHALNQKEVALRFCSEHNLQYDKVNLIVCHLGGGISITAHHNGKMIDSNDIMKGSGPMTPTRAGEMPYLHILDLAYSGEYTKEQLTALLNKSSGLIGHFGTDDVRVVERRIDDGDPYAKWVYDGMIYQIAKYIGSMAVALCGRIDGIILTGGMSRSSSITNGIAKYVSWLGEISVMPGEYEMEALASGAYRAEIGVEPAKRYTGKPVWTPPEKK